MSERVRSVLGFDVGGTKTAVLLSLPDGVLLERVEVPTRPEEGFEPCFNRIREAGREVLARALSRHQTPSHIGVSIGGPLDVERGVIYSPPNLPGWDAIPLKELLEDAYQLPTIVEHDGLAGAMAEHRFGAAKNLRHIIFLTTGTGLGAGMILNGRPYRGMNGSAGSVGHIRMAEEGPIAWGKAGCWEAFSSGSGIASLARWTYPDRFDEATTGKDVADRAEKGDEAAAEVLRTAAEYLGRGLAVLVDALNPEMIVLGSLAARLGERLLGPAMEVLRREAEPTALRGLQVVPSALGARLGDFAPLAAVLSRLEED